ncbi:MAG: SPOR domain-containing protein [Alphaproteobacteria bacterium]|nr:SPOR domain-containing protein [Alphaproteobacteria bacterium]MBV9373321.1 SPOR domain-containing protein [Alphaproteobacteria bacterium]MBV9900314.1 SPOR domain-containing protein [Alphaproteobacteria bacterium]
MTDIRAEDGASLDREDRLPWLEAVEEDEGGEGPSALKLIVAVLIGLAAIGGIVGGLFWLGNRDGRTTADGAPEVIAAPQGDYKVRPDKPGGMAVEGEGDTAFAASAGADPKGQINTNAVPEAPVTQGQRPAPAAPAAQAPAPVAKPAAQAPQAPAPAAPATGAASGATIQLGAFPNGAAAEKAWKGLSGRFAYLAPLSHSVVSANVNGKTWYRLRASGPGAAGVCGRLQVAGEQCLKV